MIQTLTGFLVAAATRLSNWPGNQPAPYSVTGHVRDNPSDCSPAGGR